MFVKKTNPDNLLKNISDSELPVVVKFYDTNCYLCNGLAEPYERLAREHIGRFKFFKVNINEDEKFCQRYLDGGIPTIQVFIKPESPILIEYPENEDPITGYPYSYLDKWLYHFSLSYDAIKDRFNNE